MPRGVASSLQAAKMLGWRQTLPKGYSALHRVVAFNHASLPIPRQRLLLVWFPAPCSRPVSDRKSLGNASAQCAECCAPLSSGLSPSSCFLKMVEYFCCVHPYPLVLHNSPKTMMWPWPCVFQQRQVKSDEEQWKLTRSPKAVFFLNKAPHYRLPSIQANLGNGPDI